MGVSEDLDAFLSTGDPIIREWILVKSKVWPFVICFMYLIVIKVISPVWMKNRKPFKLRNIMIYFNFFLVFAYTVCLAITFYGMSTLGFSMFCKEFVTVRGNVTYAMAAVVWVIYMLKYIEFLDTIFFVLRKRFDLVTNLHIIHHSTLPLVCWLFIRTERNGIQAIPAIINSLIHVVMYTYYGLAAFGPKMRKYLWWKKYLTLAQMIQFVLILFVVVVVMPLTGCSTTKGSAVLNAIIAVLFFSLFFNFYQQTFQSSKNSNAKSTDNVHSEKSDTDQKSINDDEHVITKG